MKFAIAIFALAFSTPAFAQSAPAAQEVEAAPQIKSYSSDPSGEGDPNVITCRAPQTLPDSRLKGPEVCKTNAVWAQYRKDGMTVAADGVHDVAIGKVAHHQSAGLPSRHHGWRRDFGHDPGQYQHALRIEILSFGK